MVYLASLLIEIIIYSMLIFNILFFSWATPAVDWQITKLKPKSTTPEGEYKLKMYERNVQVRKIYLSLFISMTI